MTRLADADADDDDGGHNIQNMTRRSCGPSGPNFSLTSSFVSLAGSKKSQSQLKVGAQMPLNSQYAIKMPSRMDVAQWCSTWIGWIERIGRELLNST